MLCAPTRPRRVRSEPATRAAPKRNHRYLHQHPQQLHHNKLSEPFPTAAARASPRQPPRLRKGYKLRFPGSAGLDFRNSCAFHRLLSGLLRMITEKRLGVSAAKLLLRQRLRGLEPRLGFSDLCGSVSTVTLNLPQLLPSPPFTRIRSGKIHRGSILATCSMQTTFSAANKLHNVIP